MLETILQVEKEKKEAIEFIENFMELTEREKFHINGIMLGIKISKYIQEKELSEGCQDKFAETLISEKMYNLSDRQQLENSKLIVT